MNTLMADVRFAIRGMRRSPGFTVVAILTLALGIGANTAIFSFVDGVLLKPLSNPKPEELVMLWEKPPGGDRNGISALNYLDWQNQSKSFQYMSAVAGGTLTLSGSGEPQQLKATLVSASYFELWGDHAALGRTFAYDEDQPGKDKVVVLTNRLWQSRYAADPKVLGKSITLDGSNYTIIGVLPPGVYDRNWCEIWLPLAFEPAKLTRNFHWLRAFGRLKPDVSLQQARAEMDAIGAHIAKDYPDSNQGWGVTVDRLVDRLVGPQLRQSLYVLLAAVIAVLMIGCANLANLMLARAAVRDREVAIRSALGAGRGRLVRQFLTESVMLSVMGGVAGLGLGYALMKAIQTWMPPFMVPAQSDVRLDYRVLLFTFAVAVLTGLLFGVAPALQATNRDAAESLKDGGRANTGSVSRHRLRGILIIAEVALAFVLLAGAGLLIRSFSRLASVDPGFDSTNVITMGLPMQMGKDVDGARVTSYLRQITEAVQSVPGVRNAAITSALPMDGWGFGMPFQIVGHQSLDRAKRQACFFKIVSASYFRGLGMKFRKGRELSDTDVAGGAPVTVINETMVKKYFPNEDPIGKRILVQQIVTGKHELGPEIPWQVVGVVADEKVGSLDDNSPGMYVPAPQSPIVGMDLLVRAAGDPLLLIKAIQRRVWEVNKDQPLTNMRTLEQIKTESMASGRLRTVLLGIFAAIALLLAAVGIYGVISYTVAQRTHEMGIRAALGAGSMDLLKLVIGNGMFLAGTGLLLGFLGALGLNRLLTSLLFETSTTDAPTLVSVVAILGLVAFAACYIPGRRATKVDPMVALRYE